ncbi:MAG: hypothetical protein N3E43_01070 [Sulfolobales archaeon]|nr:hypothetical protein [Sulfolobales archaeon]
MDFSKECSELKEIYSVARRLKPIKRLGQHFLVDCRLALEVLRRLEELCPDRQCCVYELGSGLGSLTIFLRKYFNYVLCSEIDIRFTDYLRRRFLWDLVDIVASDGIPLIQSLKSNCVLVSNTPYIVSSQIVASVVKSSLKSAVLVLQSDVARKLAAPPGTPNYGRIAAFTRTFMRVELGNSYSPSSFRPKPEVWSTVVVLKRLREWSEDLKGYEDFLRCVFNQRKRLLAKRLKECVGMLPDGIDLSKIRVFSAEPELLLQLYLRSYR